MLISSSVSSLLDFISLLVHEKSEKFWAVDAAWVRYLQAV